ncbi:hypothetical protein D3C72_2378360 [compost metagenome]
MRSASCAAAQGGKIGGPFPKECSNAFGGFGAALGHGHGDPFGFQLVVERALMSMPA